MANQKHVDRLLAGVEGWNRWRDENDEVPDLSGAGLYQADYRGINLSNACLRGADFRDASLIDADLRGADLRDATLSGANLSGANLKEVNFRDSSVSGADLSSADLSGADLSGATMIDANLSDSNLSECVLFNAVLTRANLTNSSLRKARLTAANFGRADLDCADFDQAFLKETIFGGSNLKEAKNLDRIRHQGPSTLDHRTLENSGKLPDIFLRGCGLPDSFIEYYPSLLNQAISYYSCFISYSHEDKAFARRLHDQLQGQGIRCWLDEHQLLPGDDIYERVDRGIKVWDKVLLCASESSLSSWWVDNEIDSAFRKEQQLTKQRKRKVWSLIPLDLDGYMFGDEWERGYSGQIKSRLAADFKGWETSNKIFEQAIPKLVKALKTDGAGREVEPVSKI